MVISIHRAIKLIISRSIHIDIQINYVQALITAVKYAVFVKKIQNVCGNIGNHQWENSHKRFPLFVIQFFVSQFFVRLFFVSQAILRFLVYNWVKMQQVFYKCELIKAWI